jgi:hypothetical protein
MEMHLYLSPYRQFSLKIHLTKEKRYLPPSIANGSRTSMIDSFSLKCEFTFCSLYIAIHYSQEEIGFRIEG